MNKIKILGNYPTVGPNHNCIFSYTKSFNFFYIYGGLAMKTCWKFPDGMKHGFSTIGPVMRKIKDQL